MSEWIQNLPLGWMTLVISALTFLATWGLFAIIMGFATGERTRAFKGVSAGMLRPLINDPNRGCKGFLPAVFAYRVAERFSRKVGGLGYLKLTAPAELVRHQSNLPDAWENDVIKTKFQAPGFKKGEFVEQEAPLNGKKAYRVMVPEYYDASCLSCHGEPKGSLDITGGKREGGKVGDLGGAISGGIYLK